ncbi:hypothetical protein D3C75_1246100 [compost metagenome]
MVARSFFNQQLRDNPRLPGVGMEAGSAMGRYPDFRRAVAAEDGTVLNQTGLGTMPGSRHRRTETGKTASDNGHVIMLLKSSHFGNLLNFTRVNNS